VRGKEPMHALHEFVKEENWVGIRVDIIEKGYWLTKLRVKVRGDGHCEVVLDERRWGC
jgi:hypothetical protein